GESSSPAGLAEAIESDVALTTAVMRAAGNSGHVQGSAGGVRQAIDALGASGVREVGASIDTYDPFESPSAAAERYERFRRHAAPAEAMVDAGSRLGLERQRIAPLLYDFPHSGETRRRATDPCPLSVREIDALRGLAEGKVYKQIARELSLSVSTIRTHLHNVYRKIGAVDRAQAVLIARDRGWI